MTKRQEVAYREGARAWDAEDECPGCGAPRPHFVSHFKKMGEHRVVVCLHCQAVYHNEQREGPLVIGLPGTPDAPPSA